MIGDILRTESIIKDPNFINAFLDIDEIRNSLLTGLANLGRLPYSLEDVKVIEYFSPDDLTDAFEIEYADMGCFLVKTEYGSYLVKENNIILLEEMEDTLAKYGIKKLFKSKNKTILLTLDGKKIITTKLPEDKSDTEKAVMIALLKHSGYSMDDVYSMVEMVKSKNKS